MATIAATGPRAMVCCWPSMVVAFAAPLNVIGIPCQMKMVATKIDSGSSTRTAARVMST